MGNPRRNPTGDVQNTLRALQLRLRKVDYNADALRQLLRIRFPDDIGALNRAPAVERLAQQRSLLATVIRLFFLEDAVRQRDIARLFPDAEFWTLLKARVLRRAGGCISARVRIDAVGDHYVLADRRFHAFDRGAIGLTGVDPVYPPGADSLILRDAVIAPAARQVLDLCTGSGIQALHTAAHATRVVAVDVNPRAVAMARMNAQLNAAHHVDVRHGDLYAPVRGEQFDLIVANPPFVASPYAHGPAYHAGGPMGDAVLRDILKGLGAHLVPGGRAFAISHVALHRGENVASRVPRWLRRFPGRALVLMLEAGTAIDLAAAQALFALERGLAAYATELRRWLEHLGRRRIATIALVLIVAERGGPGRVDVVEAEPRVLPIPLTPSPMERITAWLDIGNQPQMAG